MVSTNELINIKSKEHFAHAFGVLDSMRREEMMCDLTIVSRNTKIFAHKAVLVSRCQYFYNYFVKKGLSDKRIIELDFDPALMKIAVDYMYTNEFTVPLRYLGDLLALFDTLLLTNLMKICFNTFPDIINSNNCLLLKRLAQKGGIEQADKIVEFIDNNIETVISSEDFLQLPFKELYCVISRNHSISRKKKIIYNAVTKWINYDPIVRKTYLKSLSPFMRASVFAGDDVESDALEPSPKHTKPNKTVVMERLLVNDKLKNSSKIRFRKQLVAVGGYNERTVEHYDFETESWSRGSTLSFAISEAASVGVGNTVYVFGGLRDGTSSDQISAYDVWTNKWSRVGQMRMKRWCHSAVELDGKVYVFGGDKGNSVEKFDLKTRRSGVTAWIPFSGNINGVAAIGRKIYVVGKSALVCYDIDTSTWKKLKNLRERRADAVVCALRGKLYVIGGYFRKYLQSVEIYDPADETWRYLSPTDTSYGRAAAVVVDDKIYVVGGLGDGDVILKSSEVYDAASDRWTLLSEMNVARCRHTVSVVNNDVRKS